MVSSVYLEWLFLGSVPLIHNENTYLLHEVKSVWIQLNRDKTDLLGCPAIVGEFKGTISLIYGDFAKIDFDSNVCNYKLMLLNIPLENIVSPYKA